MPTWRKQAIRNQNVVGPKRKFLARRRSQGDESRMAARLLLPAACAACASCAFALCACAKADPADSLGRFEVKATRTQSCGDGGLLGSPEQQTYVVALRRVSSNILQWDTASAALLLSLEADGVTFIGEGGTEVDMRTGKEPEGTPPCVIQRSDSLDGTLAGSASAGYSGFEGTISYAYAPTDGSSCGDLLTGSDPIADALPCTLEYDLVGTRLTK
jgi:hypothetical protein